MEIWGHMTIMKEIIKGRDSPVMRHDTRVRGIIEKRKTERQVSSDQSPHAEE